MIKAKLIVALITADFRLIAADSTRFCHPNRPDM
jgi:hypothetical protein